MCWQCSTDELRAFSLDLTRLMRAMMRAIRTAAGRARLFPEQGVAIDRRYVRTARRVRRHVEHAFSLAGSYPICADDKIPKRHTEPAIHQEFAILLRHHHVVLLPQITNNLLSRCCVRRVLIPLHPLAELLAPLGNLASAAHPDALDLL